MEFGTIPLRKNPAFQLGAWSAGASTFLVIGVGALMFAAGSVSLGALLLFAVVMVAAMPAVTWHTGRYMPRRITLDGSGVHVKSPGGSGSYFWGDIDSVQVTTFAASQRRTAALGKRLGMDGDLPCVELSLRKLPRVSFFRSRFGTNVSLGLPVPMRRIVLYPLDPQAFASCCAPHFPG